MYRFFFVKCVRVLMSNYVITKCSYDKAKELGQVIKERKNKNKKIDVYKDKIFIASIGSSDYMYYPNYVIVYNKTYADVKRSS